MTTFAALIFVAPGLQRVGHTHCDTMDGPVIADAKKALGAGDVTPVLKWVNADHEKEIKDLFKKTLVVRKKGPEARELADMYFFETLVRVHRAGEGAPYTGLKPAGEVEPIVAASDKALESGNVDELVKRVIAAVEKGIRERFDNAVEKKKHADDSVEAGREFVEAYVVFVHYVEGIHQAVASQAGHHGDEHSKGGSAHKHE